MGIFPPACTRLAIALLEACGRQELRLATAESCTGGLIVGCLTEIAGSSSVVDRGYVVYDNRAKMEMLGVSEAMLAEHGAVSQPVAEGWSGRARPLRLRPRRGGNRYRRPRRRDCGQARGSRASGGGRPGLAVQHVRRVFPGDRAAVRMATVERPSP